MKAPIKDRGLTVSDTPRSDDEQRGDFVHIRFSRQLERENAALRKDKERLDWLTNSLGWIIVGEPEADPSQHATEDGTLADAWRAAIDAAMKEGK